VYELSTIKQCCFNGVLWSFNQKYNFPLINLFVVIHFTSKRDIYIEFIGYVHTASHLLLRFDLFCIAVNIVVLNVANIRFQCEQIMVLD